MSNRKDPRTKEENPKLDLSSLIDVSFLLLIYFLVTSTLAPREGDLGLTMPGIPLTQPSIVDFDPAIITIDAIGTISLMSEVLETNPDSRTLSILEDRLRTYQEAVRLQSEDKSVLVELHVDDAVSGQRFIDVVNCLAAVGIEEIVIADFEE